MGYLLRVKYLKSRMILDLFNKVRALLVDECRQRVVPQQAVSQAALPSSIWPRGTADAGGRWR
jgi:hypothetical protein